MALEGAVSARRSPRFSATAFRAEVARDVCGRVAEGESLVAISRDADMPSRSTLDKWALRHAAFARALKTARLQAGHWKNGPTSSYCPATAQEIFDRVCEGESVLSIFRDPSMPAYRTFYRWRQTVPEFAEMMRTAREVQAERFCALGWDLACEATPDTAYLTHVRLAHIRWMSGVLSPAYFRTRPADPPVQPQRKTLLLRHFMVEERESDGWIRVVSLTPDPETGKTVRNTPDDAPFERPPRLAGTKYIRAPRYGEGGQPPLPPYEEHDDEDDGSPPQVTIGPL